MSNWITKWQDVSEAPRLVGWTISQAEAIAQFRQGTRACWVLSELVAFSSCAGWETFSASHQLAASKRGFEGETLKSHKAWTSMLIRTHRLCLVPIMSVPDEASLRGLLGGLPSVYHLHI